MPNVTVGAVSVSVPREGGVEHGYEEYGGDRVRMEDGSLRDSTKGRKNVWTIVTSLLTAADAATLEVAIVTAPPIACSGDGLGASFSCAGQLLDKPRFTVRGVVKYRVHFRLIEV